MNRNLRNSVSNSPKTSRYSFFIVGSLLLAAVFGILTIKSTKSLLDLHTSPACTGSYTNHELVWSTSGGGFDWPDGSLSQTYSDVDNSGVSFTFTYSGETAKFDVLNDQTPCVMDFFNGYHSDALSHYTNPGFSGSGITLTIDISPAIPATIAFDLYHINGSSYSGDQVQVYAIPAAGGSNIYPSFTANSNPSWEEDGNGTVDAIAASTSSNDAYAGVNFNSSTLINQIVLIWSNCDMCGTGEHGFGLGNIEFCSSPSIFPVEWLSVSAEMSDNTGWIQWETTNEINADYYQIERQQSGNGIFETIGKLPATTQPAQVNSYQFADHQLSQFATNSKVLYRIKQVDKDGQFEYSKTVELINELQEISLKVFPNPATDIVNITYSNQQAYQELRVQDINGKTILAKKIDYNDGTEQTLNVSSWPKGNYIVSLQGTQGTVSKKLLVK